MKRIVDLRCGTTSAGSYGNNSDQRTMGAADAHDLATMQQYAHESIADFVFRFCTTCLKVPDLSEAEKLDRFVRTLVQEIRLQVELRGPANFHEAAMFVERADAVITLVAGHDVRRAASQKPKWGNAQRSPAPMRGSGDTGASGSGGPEPMELGTASRRTLTRAEYEKLHMRKSLFHLQETWSSGKKLPNEEEQKAGKRDEQLTLTVGVNEVQWKDGDSPTEPERSGQKLLVDTAVEETLVHAGVQVDEDSLPGLEMNESDLSVDEDIPSDSVLLCILGELNGIEVTFLIDSGASECFLSTAFVEKNRIKVRKTKEKLNIQLADGTVRVSNLIVEEACVTIEEHAEFIDFSVIGLPKYEAILGKPWLNRWNPVIDWKKNSLAWKMGSRVIRVQGLQEPHSSGIVSSLFQRRETVDLISAQRMRKLAKKEPVYVAMVRTTNDDSAETEKKTDEPQDQCTVSVGEDKTKTPYPKQMQSILNEFSDIFPRDLPTGLPPQRDVDHSY